MAEDIYQETLISRARDGKQPNRLPEPNGVATLDNPLCGDRVTMQITAEDGRISAVGHEVRGCMLCEATTAMIAAYAPGAAIEDVRKAADAVRAMIRTDSEPPADWPDIEALRAVHGAKNRHNCVILPFDALDEALAGYRAETGPAAGKPQTPPF